MYEGTVDGCMRRVYHTTSNILYEECIGYYPFILQYTPSLVHHTSLVRQRYSTVRGLYRMNEHRNTSTQEHRNTSVNTSQESTLDYTTDY